MQSRKCFESRSPPTKEGQWEKTSCSRHSPARGAAAYKFRHPDLCDAMGRLLGTIFSGVVATAEIGLIGETAHRAAVACMTSLFGFSRGRSFA